MELTRGQQVVWNAILNYVRREGGPPAPHVIAQVLHLTVSTVGEHIANLEAHGLLQRRRGGRGRTPELSLSLAGQLQAGLVVPVLGSIPAGAPLEAVEERIGYLNWPGKRTSFGLYVRGNSMAEYILDGDLVVLDTKAEPRSGEICAVRYGNDSTLKYLDLKGRKARLRPHNPKFKTLELPADQLHVEGVFRSLLRGDLGRLLIREVEM